MKQAIVFFIFYLILSQPSFCQDTTERKLHLFVVNLGPSFPVQEFGTHTFNRDAGFASVGANIEANYYIFPARYFGFNFCLGYANWGFNEEAYRNEYLRVMDKTEGITLNTGRYQSYKMLVGMALRTPVIKKFELLIRCQVGAAHSIHPAISVVDSENGSLNSIDKSSDNSVQGSIGAMLSYYINNKYGINLSYSGNSTTPTFHDSNNKYPAFYLPINYRNVNIGFHIRF